MAEHSERPASAIFGRALSMGRSVGLTGPVNLVARFARSRVEQV
jgi:hypothetical protein